MSEPSEISTESIESDKSGALAPRGEPIKQKRVMTEAQLENLKKAREKALEKKKQMSELTKKEKELKQQVLDKRIQQINKLEHEVLAPRGEQVVKKPKAKPQKKIVVEESESESSEESEESEESESSESEEEIKPKSKKKTVVKKYVKPKGKTTDRLVVEKQQESLEQRLMKNMYAKAWHSMHPGVPNPYE